MGIVNNIVPGVGIDVDSSTPASPIVSLDENYRTLKCLFATTGNDTLSGLAARDGVTPVAGDRAFVNLQTTQTANGIYVAAAGAWSRATDFDVAAEMIAGTLVSVTSGTLYGSSLWMFATPGPITVGVSNLLFAFLGPSFGPDTRVMLPNSAATPTQALKLLTEWIDNTAGAEVSKLTLTVQAGGAPLDVAVFEGGPGGALAILMPDAMLFNADQNTGFARPGTDNITFLAGGQTGPIITVGALTLNAGTGQQLSWGAGAGALEYTSGTGQLAALPSATQGNVQLGLAGLINTSTHGFPLIPTVVGVPTGVVTVPAGFIALVQNSTTGKLYSTVGGGVWVDVSGA